MSKNEVTAMLSRLPGRVPVFLAVVLVSAIVGGSVFAAGAPSRPITAPQTADPRPEKVQSARDSLSEAKLLFSFLTAAVSGGTATITTLTTGVGQVFDSVDTARTGAQQLATALQQAPSLSAAGDDVSRATTAASKALTQVSSLSSAVGPLSALIDRVVAAVQSNAIPGARSSLPALRSLQSAARSLTSATGGVAGLQGALAGLGPSARSAAGSVDGAIGSARRSATQLSDGFGTLSSARPRAVEAAGTLSKSFGQLTTVLKSIDGNIAAAQADLGPEASLTPPASVDATDRQVVLARDNAPLIARSILWAAVAGLLTLVVLGCGTLILRHRARRGGKIDDDPPVDDPTDDEGLQR
ncbi:hypothetical protein [Williamsia maris]|nr:hypothetical protein [Williamsia maris]